MTTASSRPHPTSRHRRRPRRMAALATLVAVLTPLCGSLATPAVAGAQVAAVATAADPSPPPEDRVSWSVRPEPKADEPVRPNFVYDVTGGQTISDAIELRNFGEEPLALKVYASDALTTQSGALDLLPAGEKPKDVGDWITLERTEVTIEPGATVTVPFTMRVPDKVESGDHTGGIVSSYLAPGSDGNQPIQVDRRLGSRVLVRAAGPLNPALSISDFSVSYDDRLSPIGRGDVRATYTVTNTGNVRMAADQRITAKGPLGLAGTSQDLPQMPELLPGNSITMTAELGAWPTVRTTSEVELTASPTRPGETFEPGVGAATATGGAWALPWATALLLLLLVGGPLIGRRVRDRRQDRERERVEAAVAVKLAGANADGSRSSQSAPSLRAIPQGMNRQPAMRTRRALAGLLLLGTISSYGAVHAHAAEREEKRTVLGALAISPVEGHITTPIALTTAGGCPRGTNTLTRILGLGFPSEGENVVGNHETLTFGSPPAERMVVPMTITIRDAVRKQPQPTSLSGQYRIVLTCRAALEANERYEFGDYVGRLTITPDGSWTALTTLADLPATAFPKAGKESLELADRPESEAPQPPADFLSRPPDPQAATGEDIAPDAAPVAQEMREGGGNTTAAIAASGGVLVLGLAAVLFGTRVRSSRR